MTGDVVKIDANGDNDVQPGVVKEEVKLARELQHWNEKAGRRFCCVALPGCDRSYLFVAFTELTKLIAAAAY